MPKFTVTPLTPSIGAEISDVDLAAPIDGTTRERLSRALAEHLALVFHDQKLTPEQYLAAAEAFGPPMRQHYSQHQMPEYPDIGLVWHRNGQQPAERWHTDHTNREHPPAATMLYGVEIPSAGGETSVANMRAAYAALPEAERRRLETLRTVNSLDDGKTDTRPEDWEKYSKPIVHPMVRTHPMHGSRAVFFHITKTLNIEGMSPEASRAYLSDLLDRMIRPEIVYTHQWRKGDVLVIDDRATMHRAHGDYDRRESRVLWRHHCRGRSPAADLRTEISCRGTPASSRLQAGVAGFGRRSEYELGFERHRNRPNAPAALGAPPRRSGARPARICKGSAALSERLGP